MIASDPIHSPGRLTLLQHDHGIHKRHDVFEIRSLFGISPLAMDPMVSISSVPRIDVPN